MCANAPSSIRTSASRARWRADGALTRRSRDRPVWPRRQSAHAMRRLPSGWISRGWSVPSAVPMPAAPTTPSACTRSVAVVGPNTLYRAPAARNHAPGWGSPARTMRSSSADVRAGSTRNSSIVSLSAYVGSPTCGVAVAADEVREVIQEQRACPRATRRSRNDPVVSAASIATRSHANTGPVSRPASICMRQTPVSSSPASSARSTGAAPRQRGKSEKCTFTKPSGRASSKAVRQQLPERDDDARIGPARGDVVDDLAGFRRRRDRQAEIGRGLLHGRRIRPSSPRAARVGLRDDERDFVTRRDQRAQRRNGRIRRPEIDEAHQSA